MLFAKSEGPEFVVHCAGFGFLNMYPFIMLSAGMLTVAASPWKSALQKTPVYAVKADLSRVHVFNEMVIFDL